MKNTRTFIPFLILASSSLLALASAQTTRTWTGNAGTGAINWSVSNNWSGGGVPVTGDTVVFNNSVKLANNNNTANDSRYSIRFDAGADSFTIGGNRIIVGSDGLINDSLNNQTINLNRLQLDGTSGSFATNNGSITLGGTNNFGTITGSGALSKTGNQTLTLNAASTYTGGTTVNNGTLRVNNTTGSGTGTGAVTVNSGGALGGNGSISGETTFNDSSIFSWNVGDTLSVGGNLVDGGGAGGSVFHVQLSGNQTFGSSFWDAAQTWTNVLTSANSLALETLFTSFSYANANGSFAGPTVHQGYFTLNGTTLSWIAVPEPSTALAGLLLGAGLLRRRRQA